MREACLQATSAALGREVTQAEARGIETRILSAMRLEAVRRPEEWRALNPQERLTEAARVAARQLVEEARIKKMRLESAVIAKQRLDGYLQEQIANPQSPDVERIHALQRLLAPKYDNNNNVQSVESRANGYFDVAVGQLADVFETLNPGLFKRVQDGMIRLEPMRRDFVNALHGRTQGVAPEIVEAAKRYHEIADSLRVMFNGLGGVVGKLEDWGMPHNWSARLALKRGREAWANDMTRWADRRRYIKEDGAMMNDGELRAFFEEAWHTVATEGASKERDAMPFPGGAMKANRGSHHRQIHLKAENVYDALKAYSEQNALDAMIGSLRRMSRDIALLEQFGPNPDYMVEQLIAESLTADARALPDRVGRQEEQANYLREMYANLAGNVRQPRNRPLANAAASLRALQVASKLGSAVISSISDIATLHQTAMLNRLNPLRVALNASLAWAPKSRRFAKRIGLMTATLTGYAERYASDNLTARDLSARTASLVVRASGLNFVTEARRIGFSMTMMDTLGHLTRQYQDVTKLKGDDYRILAAKGIDQAVWNIWRAAKIDSWGMNATLLTPEAIMRTQGFSEEAKRNAAAILMGAIKEEQDLAVITPGVRERTQLTFGTTAGTAIGEIARSMVLFKSFPWTVTMRHFERAGTYGEGGRAVYLAALFITMSTLGVVAHWINDLLAGRDPRPINPGSEKGAANIFAGALKGGGLGIFGDFLFAETTLFGNNTLAETLLGPQISTTSQFLGLTAGNAVQAAQGKETNIGPEAVRFARSMTPGANLWYTKALSDRYIFNLLQEELQPGYVQDLQERRQRLTGSEYWWDESALTPSRAPELEGAVQE